MKPDERQLWRVVNASAITYLDLQILIGGTPQPMGLFLSMACPVNEGGMAANRIVWEEPRPAAASRENRFRLQGSARRRRRPA